MANSSSWFRSACAALALVVAASTAQAGTTSTNDPHGYPPGCPPDCSGAGGHSGGSGGAGGGTGGGAGGGATSPTPGMPVYSISPMLISLTMRDTPLSYRPPVGPAMDVTLSYNQLDIDQPTHFTYSNLGPKWTFNWLGYVQDDPSAPGSSKTLVYLETGPGRLYSGYDAGTGAFAPEPETGAQLVRVQDSPVTYERRFPDGSKDVFAEDDGSSQYPRRIFLTRRVDAQGNAVSLAYDDQHRLTQVADTHGHALAFDYADAERPFLITGAHDSFGRSVSLDYDASGRLAGVTDAIGMHSSFGYDGGTNITSLSTPYGETTFSSHQSGTRRWIDITNANGDTSRMEFNQAVSGVPFSESQVPQGIHAFNRYINSRDTFFWDAQAFKEAAGNYSKAVIYHWTHKTSGRGLSSVTADALESVKYPLESRIWYDHPDDISGGSGSLNMPSVIARVLPDGSTQITRNTYNDLGRLLRSIDPTGLQTDYTYAPNQVDLVQVERTGPDGYHAVETYSYNDQHRVLSHTDETGAATHYTYNDAGQLLTETDALGGVTRYGYDESGNKTTVTDANGHVTTYGYDALGRMTRMTDPLGRATTYAYDVLNRLVRTTFPDGSYEAVTWNRLDKAAVRDRNSNVTTFTYDALRHCIGQTDALGETTSWTYYPNGLLKSRTDANGHTTTWQRDLEGRITAVTDANGATGTFAYDSADRRIRSTNALGQSTAYAYDRNDRLTRTIDANGVIVDSAYTSRGWLSSRTTRARADGTPSAADATASFAYNGRGDQTAATDADGVAITRTYDAARRLVAVDDAFGNTHVYTRDAVGNLLAEADSAAGNTQLSRLSSYEYDAANQRVRFLDADGQVTQYSYDPNGRLSDTRDPLGIHASSVFDPEGQLVRSIAGTRDAGDAHAATGDGAGARNASAAISTYRYDAAERLVAVVDPDGLATRYVYDPVGQKVRQESPDTGTTTYSYDAAGNRTGQTDARGVVTEQRFDAIDRVIATHYPSDPSLDAVIHYDEPDAVTGCSGSFPVGRTTRVFDASGSTSYCYDAHGNVTAVHRVIAGHPYETFYTWTPGNRLATLSYPSGTRVTYRYDVAGRVVAVDSQSPTQTGPVPLVSGVDYLPFGPASRMAYGTGSQAMVRSYDGNYRGTGIEGLGLHLKIERDANGNVTGLREGQGHGPLTERYRYDALQRLTQTIGPYGWFNQQYSYDATGDRLTRHQAGGAPQSYSYQPGTHRLSAISQPGQGDEHGRCDHGGPACMAGDGVVLSDAAGNIVQMPQDGQVLTLAYGASNRLMRTSTTGGAQGRYTYDANGLRAEKTTNTPTEQTRDFVYNGAHLLGEYVVGTGTSREYVWLGETLVASLDSSARESAVHYVGTDFLGTPRSVTDAEGMPVWNWAYAGNAFGDSAPVGAYELSLRFPGQYHDAESGLNQNTHRDFSTALGRYIESDPIGLNGGLGSYVYAGNDPLDHIDMLGLCEDKQHCEDLHRIDTDVCNAITRRRGRAAGAACHASASERYAACYRDKPLPPLNTWNNRESMSPTDWAYWEQVTGLTGAALAAYLIVSEGSRLFPPRNLVPVP